MQELVGEAAGAGSYSDVEWLTRCAKQLRDLRVSVEQARDTGGADRLHGGERAAEATSTTPRKRRPSRRRSGRAGYPRFFRGDDHLVKIGWSKKKHSEYTHKAPRERVRLVVSALARLGGNGAVIPTDALLAVEDTSGEEIPHYQTYLALAWLRAEGVIKKRGRTGYTIEDRESLRAGFDELWKCTVTEGAL